jgi:hypothetical protein
MAILNYSTTIDALKTVGEVEYILIKHGAKSILKDISPDGSIGSLSFIVETPYGPMPIRLPVNVDPVLAVLIREKAKRKQTIKATKEQAERVAWRILKDWVEAQMALIEIEMVKMEQVFLPYAILGNSGQTVFENLQSRQFLLT